MKNSNFGFVLAFVLLIAQSTSAQTLVTSGLNAVISSGTVTISTNPRLNPVSFPVSNAKWIWNENWSNAPVNETLTFFSSFRVNCFCKKFTLFATADDKFSAFINGKFLINGSNWSKIYSIEIPSNYLYQGGNTL